MPRHADADRTSRARAAATSLADAQALIRAGRPGDAIPSLERMTAATPGDAGAWIALGVAHSMVGEHARAVEAAARGVVLAPRIALVHLAHGDVLRMAGQLGAARNAYAAAVDLAPDNADALNKLAGSERIDRDFDAARAHLLRALAHLPAHPYAQVNLATLAVEEGALDEARRRLTDVLRLSHLPRDAADEASATLAMLDEHVALAPVVARAGADGDPAPLEDALRARGEPARRDERWVAIFDALIARTAGEAPIDGIFPRGRPTSACWSAIEAHHNFRGLGGATALATTIERIASNADEVETREIRDYASVVARSESGPFAFADGAAWEAWLRFTHAGLVASRPAYWPGQLKPVNNLLPSDPQRSRPEPLAVAGTLRTVMTRIDAELPPGAWRACLRYCAIIEIHPFRDGNGRLARYVLNRTLEDAGLFPSLRPDNDELGLARSIQLARRHGDLRGIAEQAAKGAHYAADLDRRWAERSAR
ncbi:MAG: tetratricopeptide repeat protein [Vicinamibacteria bacterium]